MPFNQKITWFSQSYRQSIIKYVSSDAHKCIPFLGTKTSSFSRLVLSTRLQHSRLLCPSISLSLLKLMSIESVIPSSHLILFCPLLLLPSVFPRIRVFSNELALHIRWPKYWSFNFIIRPFNEYSELISFRIDWLDLLAVQVTLRSIL